MNQPNSFLVIIRMLTPSYQFRARRRRTISRQAQDWQFPSRNRLGRDAECKVWNSVSHIQASGTPPTVRMISRLISKDSRQVRRILKRLELAGTLVWLHNQAKYRNNRLQHVPILLRWDYLRQIEPTRTSTLEPTRPNTLRIKGFKKEKTDTIENASVLASEIPVIPKQEQPPSQANPEPIPAALETYPNTWAKETGFEIPNKDLLSILDVVLVKTDGAGSGLPLDFLSFMIETVWLRATRPERHWKAFYATAVAKMLKSETAYNGTWERYWKRDELYQKWRLPSCDVSAWTPERIAEYREKGSRA